jgi:hypothetical protein
MGWHMIPVFAVAVAFTFAVHEGAHWAMGELLGYDMYLRVNSAGLARGAYESEFQGMLVTAAGPAVTVLQGLIAYACIQWWQSAAAFPFLLSSFLMRSLAAGVSISNPNDEARLSMWLGFDKWAVFAAVLVFLLVLVLLAVRRLGLGGRAVLLGCAYWVAFASFVVLGERYLPTYNPYAT